LFSNSTDDSRTDKRVKKLELVKLYILRHAEAEEKSDSVDDFSRHLTARGRKRMGAAAVGMRRLKLNFDTILTSPLARALETAELIAQAYGNRPAPKKLPSLATGIAPAHVLNSLAPYARYQHVMIVGHEPQLSGLVSLLLVENPEALHIEFKKGACAAVELLDPTARGSGTLLWMLTARQLGKVRK
jgi:phosphohistidine phosphatase